MRSTTLTATYSFSSVSALRRRTEVEELRMAHPTAPYRVHRVQHATCTAVNLMVSHRFLVLERRMIDL